jgi:hypothetical protein
MALEAIQVSKPDSLGNRLYRVMQDGIRIATIVKVSTARGEGWRVNTRIPGKRGSRTISATPYEATKKYFRTAMTLPGNQSGRCLRFRTHPFYKS